VADAAPALSHAAPAALRVAFAGTPAFAASALRAIVDAGFAVPLVLTQPDRTAGRGMKLQPSAVKQLALQLGLALAQPAGLRLTGKHAANAEMAQAALEAAAPEVMVVAAYGLILPDWVLALPRLGCLNIHGSLLPRWRGAAPIQRAIEAGDAQTGITLMQMDAGLDTGAMLLRQAVPIGPDDTAGSLQDSLAALGARLIVRGLQDAMAGRLQPVAQPEQGVTYAKKIDKAEAAIDWLQPAADIERRLRAFDPFPGCTTHLGGPGGQAVKLWRGHVADLPAGSAAPGERLATQDGRLITACGDGRALEWLQMQLPGGRRQSVVDCLQGHPELAG
jgi:methionyl-tRNA formyltransferase